MISAIQAVKKLKFGAGKRVVVILPDGVRNYMNKFVCDQWMEAYLFKELPERDCKYDHIILKYIFLVSPLCLTAGQRPRPGPSICAYL